MGKKGGMPVYKSMDDYINVQSKEAQEKLNEIRSIIRKVIPGVGEGLNCKVPTFKITPGAKAEQQIMMAAYIKFIGFYPFPTTMAAFANELKDYKQGKGSAQVPLNKDLPTGLIERMVKYRRDEVLGS